MHYIFSVLRYIGKSFSAFLSFLGAGALLAGIKADVPNLEKEPGLSSLVTGFGTLLLTIFSLIRDYPKTALLLWILLAASLAYFEPRYKAHNREFDDKRTKKGKSKGKKGKRK